MNSTSYKSYIAIASDDISRMGDEHFAYENKQTRYDFIGTVLYTTEKHPDMSELFAKISEDYGEYSFKFYYYYNDFNCLGIYHYIRGRRIYKITNVLENINEQFGFDDLCLDPESIKLTNDVTHLFC